MKTRYLNYHAWNTSFLGSPIDDFGVSEAIDGISVWMCKLTLDTHNFMKIRENPEIVLSGLWILLHATDLQATDEYKNLRLKMKLEIDI